jgi:hypothetical protein
MFAGLAVGVLGSIVMTFVEPPTRPDYQKSMWLTEKDLEELRPTVRSPAPLRSEQMAEILQRQLRNLYSAQESPRQSDGSDR